MADIQGICFDLINSLVSVGWFVGDGGSNEYAWCICCRYETSALRRYLHPERQQELAGILTGIFSSLVELDDLLDKK